MTVSTTVLLIFGFAFFGTPSPQLLQDIFDNTFFFCYKYIYSVKYTIGNDMSDPINPEEDDRKFELSLRLMGNEVIAIALFSNSPSNRWLWMSIGAVLILFVSITLFGADISSFYKSLLG